MANLRYLAADRLTYARALVELTKFARDWDGPAFSYGPLDVRQLEQAGLEVQGDALAEVQVVLSGVPGLVEETA